MHALLSVLGLATHLVAATSPTPELRGEPLMTALQRGGYTIVLRHARTDRSFQEAMGYVPASRAQQRNLNDDGVRDARLMGVVLKKYAIPLGEIVASPMYRTMETAEYAAGPATPTMVLRAFPPTDEQRKLIAVVPKPGTNRLLVTHHFVLETHIPGIKPGDIAESEAAVVRTTGEGGIELVGRILLADWRALAGVEAPPAGTPSIPPPGHGAPPHAARSLPAGPVSYPDTPIGRLAERYVAAFSSGDTARMRGFIETSLAVDPGRPVEERLASYAKLFAEHGPLLVGALEPVSSSEFHVMGQTRKGIVHIIVLAPESQAGRASSITLRFEARQP